MREPFYYTLTEDNQVVPCDILTWGRMLEDGERRRVARTKIGDLLVSTVFIGIDHRFDGVGPPLVFETMIFVGDRATEEYCERCSTWAEAEAMHAAAVKRATP